MPKALIHYAAYRGHVVGLTRELAAGASPNVPELLSDVALAQHGPWDVSDGGAGTTGNGVACLDNWLVTQAQAPVTWDLITFNFGLHDLDNATAAESEYMEQLVNITTRLQATGAQLLYITTTPYMPLRLLNNTVVEDLNAIANVVMAARGVPVLDLYTLVTDHCGAVPYEDCDWCRKHPCSYHYNAEGMEAQAKAVAQAIRSKNFAPDGYAFTDVSESDLLASAQTEPLDEAASESLSK